MTQTMTRPSDDLPPRLEIRLELPLGSFPLRVDIATAADCLGVFGPSGAGKTSLLEAVAGLRRARGKIRVGAQVWLDTDRSIDRPPRDRRVGYVPQDGLLFPHWSVRRNLLAGRARADSRSFGARFDEIVALLELEPLLERLPSTLSGGERQRVALGRALCSGPRLLLLDEPLAALDLPLRRRLLPTLRRIRRELTVPMLLVTHDPTEAQVLCDELLVLRRGEVVGQGAPRRLLADPSIFSLAGLESFETVLDGRLVLDGTAFVDLGQGFDGPLRLVVRRPPDRSAGPVLVGLRADDLLLATEPPRGLSARNVVAARVEEVTPTDLGALARVALGPDPSLTVAVELAAGTADALSLAPGRPVQLVVKASSVRVLPGG